MRTETDVVILGLGTGGEDLGLQLLDAGLEVVGVEPALVGGECAYWACIPSKMMIRAGNLVQEARRLEGMAGRAEIDLDWGQVAARVRDEAAGGWDDTIAVERFRARGGTVLRGHGSIEDPKSVRVGDDLVGARVAVVIATGSQPAIPPIPGLDQIPYWTSHDVIQADTLPISLAVLGGGAVGCELGQVLARFGVEVTIVEGLDRVLAHEEPEASQVVADSLIDSGVTVMAGVRVVEARHNGSGTVVVLEGGNQLESEVLLVATGRRVDLAGLGLDNLGVDTTTRFLEVDDHMRVVPGVWALGDVTGRAMFTHAALRHSAFIAAEILGKENDAIDHSLVPHVTFTDPEVGSIGLTEASARESGIDVDVVVKSSPASFRGWLHGPGNPGFVKLVANRGDGVLVGATAVGPHGGEVIAFLQLAVQEQVPLQNLRQMFYAFPTFTGAVGEAVGAFARGLESVIDPGFSALSHP